MCRNLQIISNTPRKDMIFVVKNRLFARFFLSQLTLFKQKRMSDTSDILSQICCMTTTCG